MSNAAVLIVTIPLSAAMIIALLDLTRARRFSGHIAVACLASCFGLALVLAPRILAGDDIIYTLGSWDKELGISIVIDNLTMTMVLLGNFLGVLVLLYAVSEKQYEPKFYALILITMAGLSGTFLSTDVFNIFVFVELLSIASYVLVARYGHKGSLLAGMNYLLISSAGLIVFLFGIGVLYRHVGTLNMFDMADELPLVFKQAPRALMLTGALFVIGFGVKCAMVPLHTWLPDAHSIAPSPISALLSGIVIKVGIYGLFRTVQMLQPSGMIGNLYTLLLYMGAATALFGALMALVQTDLKRMLAYSSINQIGYILVGIGLGTAAGTSGALFHTATHAVAKCCLFLCAGAIIERTGKRKISELGMVSRQMPGLTTIFVLASLSIVGIPPAAGFFSKLTIGLSCAKAGQPAVAFLILVTSVVSGAYFLRCISSFFKEKTDEQTAGIELSRFVYLPLVVLVATIFVAPLVPRVGEIVLRFVSGAEGGAQLW